MELCRRARERYFDLPQNFEISDGGRIGGLSDSEAVRTALREAAAKRLLRSAIAAEARDLAAHDADRAEMQVIREQMTELAPPAEGEPRVSLRRARSR